MMKIRIFKKFTFALWQTEMMILGTKRRTEFPKCTQKAKWGARQCWGLVFNLLKSWRSARLIRECKSGTEERYPHFNDLLMTSCNKLILCVFGVERSMSETARRTSRGRKIGAWCICDAPKARPAGPSPHLGCVFVKKAPKETNGEARRA